MRRIIWAGVILALSYEIACSSAVSAEPDACNLLSPAAVESVLKSPITRQLSHRTDTAHGPMLSCGYIAGGMILSITVTKRNSSIEAKKSIRGMLKALAMPETPITDAGVGDEAISARRMLFVREADTIYSISIVGHISDDDVESREVAIARAAIR